MFLIFFILELSLDLLKSENVHDIDCIDETIESGW